MSTTYLTKAQELADRKRGLVRTHQGGDAYAVTDSMEMLRRFCILGTTGGSFYVDGKTLTDEGVAAVQEALDEHGIRAVDEIVRISDEGIAAKLDAGIFAYALASSHPTLAVRQYVYAPEQFNRMLRTASQLFTFLSFRRPMGMSSGLLRAIKRWYDSRDAKELVYQGIKYRERAGFSHRDTLRLAYGVQMLPYGVKAPDREHNAIYRWLANGEIPNALDSEAGDSAWFMQLTAFEAAQEATAEGQIVSLIRDHDLPREAIPTSFLSSPAVWDALLARMPLTATIRNLGTMSKVGLLVKRSDATQSVIARLADETHIRKARVHPMSLFIAARTYESGAGVRSNAHWTVDSALVDALDTAYRLAFANVEASGKKLLVAVDSSGSMQHGIVSGTTGIAVAEAAGALAQILAITEPNAESIAVDTGLHQFAISDRQRVTDVARMISLLGGGGTYLDLAYDYARQKGFDGLVMITDSEQGRGGLSSSVGKFAHAGGRSVLVQLAFNRYSAVDASPQSLRLVGLDPNVPRLASAFAAGTL